MGDAAERPRPPVGAPWKEEEVVAFARTLATFRDGLRPRERAAFTQILEAAAARHRESGEVEGFAASLAANAGAVVGAALFGADTVADAAVGAGSVDR